MSSLNTNVAVPPNRRGSLSKAGVAHILPHLEALPMAKPSLSGEWSARCPCHDDGTPSLSWTTTADGKVLLKCRADCTTEDVVAAVDCTMADLFPPRQESERPRPKVISKPEGAHARNVSTFGGDEHLRGQIAATYDYRDAAGEVRHQTVRYTPKGFVQRRPDGKGGWINNLDGVERLLYRIPELLARATEPVFITEGERDADRLASLGLVATTNPMGAGKWRPEYAEYLRGRDAVVLVDCDDPGRRHARSVALSAFGAATSTKVLALPGLPDHGDVSDWLDAGGTVEELVRLVKTAPLFKPDPGYRLVRLSEVVPEQVDWCWLNRIPFGMVTGLYGDPAVGKSTLALDFVARVTTGRPMPDDTPGVGPFNVIVMSAEDPLAEVILPRLAAAGADLGRVYSLPTVSDGDGATERPVVIPDDLEVLEAMIRDHEVKLVVIDVLMAFLAGSVNSYRDQDVRRALATLHAIAERTGAAIIVIGHLTKNGQQAPIHRVGGSVGIVGAFRACHVAAQDPDDPGLQVFAPLKMNLARKPGALAYRIDDVDGTGAVVWAGTSTHTAATLLPASRAEGSGKALQEAIEFLDDLLRDGPVPASTVEEMAGTNGISNATLRRARTALHVRTVKHGRPGAEGYWALSLPAEDAQPDPEGAQPRDVSDFGQDEQFSARQSPSWACFFGMGHIPALRADGSTYCATCHPGVVA